MESGGLTLAESLEDSVYHERRRLKEDRGRSPGTKKDTAFWELVGREMRHASDKQARSLVRRVVRHYGDEIAGNFDDRVYQVVTRAMPPALGLLLNAVSPLKLVRRLPVDVLYLDPPYNQRQYAKNYHVLEVLAELHTIDDLPAYEQEIYGKTGLRTFEDRRSDYCRRSARRRGPSPCALAFADLVKNARAEHIVVSYSEEGILSREEIGRALADAAGQQRYDFARDHEEVSHKRFRSDRQRKGRNYRVLEGRDRDEVAEWLFYVRKQPARKGSQLAG